LFLVEKTPKLLTPLAGFSNNWLFNPKYVCCRGEFVVKGKQKLGGVRKIYFLDYQVFWLQVTYFGAH
jgi:hypothetical protein